MQKPFVLLLDGMMGAGKTTTSGMIADNLKRVAIIGMDRVKFFVSDFTRCKEDNLIARNIVYVMTDEYLAQGISVVVEHPIKDQEELKRYEVLAENYEVPLHKIQLFTKKEVAFERILARQKNRDPNAKRGPVPEKRIQRNLALFQERSKQGFTVIDTTRSSPQEVYDKVLKQITD